MALQRCDKGHYYDPESYSNCPSCGTHDLNLQATQMRGAAVSPDDGVTQARGASSSMQRDTGVTVAIVRKKTGMDPVVGWLVCVDGPEKGRDYRIRSEKNYIGRDSSMDICISGDETISRENHAMISFNPRNLGFSIAPGNSRGLVYLNGKEVGVPEDLKPYDLIELGQCKLSFVAFCGEKFQWVQDTVTS
jgi:hypothetical protein